MMKRITVTLVLSLVLALSALFVCGAGSPASAYSTLSTSSSYPGVPSGYGYAIYVITPTGSGNFNYGPSVPVALSCTTPPATNTVTNSGPALSSNSLVASGSARSTITINRTTDSLSVQTSEDIYNLRLLGGIITANELHAVVTSTVTATGATSHNSSSLSELTVAGLHISSNPAPNTKLTLPGLGFVILNEQNGPYNGTQETGISVMMMDIHITSLNTLGFAPGTRINVAYVQSEIQVSAVHGAAYSLYALGPGGSNPAIGPIVSVRTGCQGESLTAGLHGYKALPLVSTGDETSSASAELTTSIARATAQNIILNLHLLNGLISADKVETVANASWNGSGSHSGSATFINVKIAGRLLPTQLAPNTRVNLPGIGYVILNEETGSNNSVRALEYVIGMDIYITVSHNSTRLSAGTRIIVSNASASASSY